MITEFTKQLCCPVCHGRFELEDLAQSLKCTSCGSSYKIVDDIPRFVSQAHLASFGLQWNKYEVVQDEEDRATFHAKTGLSFGELKGLTVLDAGCGGGRYSKVAAEAGATVIAVDHSTAVGKAAELCQHLQNVRFLQADLKKLPLQPDSFDFVFSIGVMHHDADTRQVFDAVATMVRPGGRLAVWLYRRNQWWQESINNVIRGRTTRMPSHQLEQWCKFGARLGGLPVIKRTLNKVVNFSSHSDWQNRVCDTFDWYAPQYQHHHTINEVCQWFHDAGFEQLTVLAPEKMGHFYRWAYRHNLIIGSGVNILGSRSISQL